MDELMQRNHWMVPWRRDLKEKLLEQPKAPDDVGYVN